MPHDNDGASRPYDVAGLPRKADVGTEGFFALDLRGACRGLAVE